MSDAANMVTMVTTIQAYASLSVGFMFSMAGLGSALGWGLLGTKYLEGITRQPELMASLRVQLFITAGLMESFPFIVLALGMWFVFANPFLVVAKESLAG